MQPLNRRTFLGTAGLLVAGTLVAPSRADAVRIQGQNKINRSTFRPLRSGTFTAQGVDATTGRFRLTLQKVQDIIGAPTGDEHAFSLQFHCPNPVPDGIYRLSHGSMKPVTLFISGVDLPSAHRFAAVINQNVPRDAPSPPKRSH
jgi:hypothetical protein